MYFLFFTRYAFLHQKRPNRLARLRLKRLLFHKRNQRAQFAKRQILYQNCFRTNNGFSAENGFRTKNGLRTKNGFRAKNGFRTKNGFRAILFLVRKPFWYENRFGTKTVELTEDCTYTGLHNLVTDKFITS
jgi:hypothetical protein